MRSPVPHSEIAGPGFDASGTRLYFASQGKRHTVNEATGEEVRGEIFEITGPFRNTDFVNPDPGTPDDRNPPTGSSGALGAATLGALGAAALLAKLCDQSAAGEDGDATGDDGDAPQPMDE